MIIVIFIIIKNYVQEGKALERNVQEGEALERNED